MATRLLTDAVANEITRRSLRPALLFEGTFGNQTLYLWSGQGDLTWDGKIFAGSGSMMGTTPVREAEDLTPNGFALQLNGVDAAVKSLVLNSSSHRDTGKIWLAFLYDTNRENLLPYSSDFTQWTATKASVVANSTTDPLTLRASASLLRDNAETDYHLITATGVGSVVNGEKYVYSILARRRELNTVRIRTTGALACDVSFNIGTGAIHAITLADRATITPLIGGWYLLRAYATAGSSGTPVVEIHTASLSGVASYLGTGAQGLFITQAQLQRQSTTQQPTETAGAIIQASGPGRSVIADPYLLAKGQMDVPTLVEGAQESLASISYASKLHRLNDRPNRRYTQEGQKMFYPADRGFEHVANLQRWTGTAG